MTRSSFPALALVSLLSACSEGGDRESGSGELDSAPDAGPPPAAPTLPDLTIDADYLASTVRLTGLTVGADSCEMVEQCVGGTGLRSLLEFGLRTPNTGAGDLVLGNPRGNPLFEFSSCHGHYHFKGYMGYRLLDASGRAVAEGVKQSFALMDVERLEGTPDTVPSRFNGSYQGISAGFADVYGAGLACQWLDVTDVPPGDYVLEATVNPDGVVEESTRDNNQVRIPVTVPANSCPGGCSPWSDDCCTAGNPCGLEADSACSCGGAFPWDEPECSSCVSDADECDAPWTCSDTFCTADPWRMCDAGEDCLTNDNHRRQCTEDPDCRPAGDDSCPVDFCVDGDAHDYCDRGDRCTGPEGESVSCADDRDCEPLLHWRACAPDFCLDDDPQRFCDEGASCEMATGRVRRCDHDADCR